MRPVRQNQLFGRLQSVLGMFLVLGLLAVGASPAYGQADQGAIVGMVSDSTGAVIPNAQVTLTNTETGLVLHTSPRTQAATMCSRRSRSVCTRWKVRGARVLARRCRRTFTLHVQDRVEANLQLEARVARTTVVTVTHRSGAAPNGRRLDRAGNRGADDQRHSAERAQLGLHRATDGGRGALVMVRAGRSGGDFNANGQRAEQNNYIMDGVDNNVNVVDFFNSSELRRSSAARRAGRVQGADRLVQFGVRPLGGRGRQCFSIKIRHQPDTWLTVGVRTERRLRRPRVLPGNASPIAEVPAEPVRRHARPSQSSRTSCSSSATLRPTASSSAP